MRGWPNHPSISLAGSLRPRREASKSIPRAHRRASLQPLAGARRIAAALPQACEPTPLLTGRSLSYRHQSDIGWLSSRHRKGLALIIAIANVKGGCGKTTIATNFAIARALAGRDTLLVDADDQGSAADFTALRTEQLGKAGYTVMRLRGREVRTEVEKLIGKFEDIVVDVGGRDNEGLRAALTVADAVLIPLTPSSFDVWALDRMVGLVREAKGVNPKLRAVAALNAADAQGHDNDEALSVLRDTEGVEALTSMLIRRKAYRNAAAQGRGVTDMNPKDPKAVEEMQTLVRAIFPTAE
jgi:chromosome partitioning protein